mmetsp:Transcript_4529/g.10704  ORF Transcript_4529/g.10704 Transcript_4529/m.10704 type:complete len:357 (-) Transcript_4529:1500-2570(-)
MKYLATLFLARSALAFHVPLLPRQHRNDALMTNPPLQMTMDDGDAPSDMDDSAYDSRQDLLDVAKSLKDEFGPLIIDSKAQEKLKSVVGELEKNSEPPVDTEGMIGDWTLLCSTASTEKFMGIDTSNLPFFNADIVKDIRSTLNKSLQVQQKIKLGDSGEISRVDHVIQYMPPNELSAFTSALPDALQSLNINPLEVTKEEVILVHKADVESTIPFINTKLALESIVLNIAGKSQYLEPEGADLLGVNVPFGEFLNSGSFDTTYVDDELRISRSKVGVVDQLRVFVREASTKTVVVEETEEPVADAEIVDAPSDVEDEGTNGDDEVADEPVAEVDDSDDEADDSDVDAPSDVEGSD